MGVKADGRAVPFRSPAWLPALLFAALAALGAVSLAATWRMAQAQDDLAARNAQIMVQLGLEGLIERAETQITDYAVWTEGYNRIVAQDMAWIALNIGSGLADFAVVSPAADAPAYGWTNTMEVGSAPSTDLMSPLALAAARRVAARAQAAERTAGAAFARLDDGLWLVAAAMVTPADGAPEGARVETSPVQIFGYRMDGARIEGLAQRILLQDIAIGADAGEGAALPLRDEAGEAVAWLTWRPPRPGSEALRTKLPLILLGCAAAAAAAFAAAVGLVRSARRLEAALAAAQVANRAKSEFLSTVSHELRTPMNGVLGVAALLRATDLSQRQTMLLDVLNDSAQSQVALISDLLTFTQLESGDRAPERVIFCPRREVEQVLAAHGAQARRKGLAFTLDVQGDADADVCGDAHAFRQICESLTSNALKFTEAGAVSLTLALRRHGGVVDAVLSVADTGPGIAAEHHARIFERFTQVDSSMTRAAGGMGLGLAIASSLAALIGARLSVASAKGAGSTFTLAACFDAAGQGGATATAPVRIAS